MPEWLNGAACEAVKGFAFRGFESRFHRQSLLDLKRHPKMPFGTACEVALFYQAKITSASTGTVRETPLFYQTSPRSPTEKALEKRLLYRPRSD
jgi:hypothetical protein